MYRKSLSSVDSVLKTKNMENRSLVQLEKKYIYFFLISLSHSSMLNLLSVCVSVHFEYEQLCVISQYLHSIQWSEVKKKKK